MLRELVLSSLIVGCSSIYKGYKQVTTGKVSDLSYSQELVLGSKEYTTTNDPISLYSYLSIFKKEVSGEQEDTDEKYFIVDEKGKLLKYIGLDAEVKIPKTVNNRKILTLGEKSFYKKNIISVVIPHGVVKIEDSAFEWNKLTTVSLPITLKFIGNHAFSSNELEYLTLPTKIKSVGKWAFAWNNIETLTIPKSLKVLNYCSFYANKLNTLTIHSGVISLDAYAFGKNNLTSIHLPKTVTNLDERAFSYNDLDFISLPNTIAVNMDNMDELDSSRYHFYEPVKDKELATH